MMNNDKGPKGHAFNPWKYEEELILE